MRDVTAIAKVGVAGDNGYDLCGFESVLIIGPVTTAYSLTGATFQAGDDADSMEDLPIDSPAIIARYDDDGKTAKISYIGGRRYLSVSGITPTAVILMNPDAAPVGDMEAPDESAAEEGTPAGRAFIPRANTSMSRSSKDSISPNA